MTPDQALRYADALSFRRASLSAEERERELEALADLRDEIAAALLDVGYYRAGRVSISTVDVWDAVCERLETLPAPDSAAGMRRAFSHCLRLVAEELAQRAAPVVMRERNEQ